MLPRKPPWPTGSLVPSARDARRPTRPAGGDTDLWNHPALRPRGAAGLAAGADRARAQVE